MRASDEVPDGLAELWAAATVADLHKLMVTGRVLGRSTSHHEAVELFVHHHTGDPTDAGDTALLLCTERRWSRCTAKLIAGLAGAGILDDDGLGALAHRLLWHDRPTVRHPLSWLGLTWHDVDLHTGEVVRRMTYDEQLIDTPCGPVPPPLLRWAAHRLLRHQQADLHQLRERASCLDPHGAASVISGILDAVDRLSDDDARRAVELGLASGLSRTRKVALRALADRIDVADAVRRARSDSDRSIREWAAQLEPEDSGCATLF